MAVRRKTKRAPAPKRLDNPEELLALINAKALTTNQPLFKPEYIEQARKLYRKGWTDREVADFFEVSRQTVQNWLAACPEFARIRKDAKAAADELVKDSLYERARGYEIPVEKIFCKDGAVTKVMTMEHIPASVSAAKYWLSNRDPNRWKDRQEVTGANGEPLNPSSIELIAPKRPTIEIARRIVYLMQRATDEQNGGPQPLLIEEKVTTTQG
jgi:hypothetical protein